MITLNNTELWEMRQVVAGLGNGAVWQRMRARRASVLSQKAPFDALRLLRSGYKQFARLAPDSSLRKRRWLGMTTKLHHYQGLR